MEDRNGPGIRLWEVQRPKRQGHPRHPPRAFSLGLLAPSMVCAALFLALPRLRARCSGAAPFGGRKDSFLQRPPRLVRPLRGAFCIAKQGSANRRSPTPFLVFVIVLVVSLSLRISVAPINVGAHPLSVGRPSENARGGAQGSQPVLAPARASTRGLPPVRAQIPAVKDLITAAPFTKFLRKTPSAPFCPPF